MSTALILSGGGARAAYQVGVLRAVLEILDTNRQPFDIVCGTSAGSINAAYYVASAHRPRFGMGRLHHVWRNISAANVYDTSWLSVLRTTARLGAGAFRYTERFKPPSILDNSPLERLLTRWLDFGAMRANLRNGYVRNLCINAVNYSTGESVAFYEGETVEPWQRLHRHGEPVTLSLDHVMASAAIPILFPPRAINGNFFGDGALRQLNPLSPALHLGARRLFVIGVSSNKHDRGRTLRPIQPTIAQMAGHLLNREFIDNLEADIEQAEVINELLDDCALGEGSNPPAQKVEFLVITPSTPFDEMAARYIDRQPGSMRFLFRLLGAQGQGAGASFASLLLFDGGYCQAGITQSRSAGFLKALNNSSLNYQSPKNKKCYFCFSLATSLVARRYAAINSYCANRHSCRFVLHFQWFTCH
ncbi:MAG: patatin-like phospholipase family protein [Gammaproteobacteria bacterium]|nr:patatin-like phospholipase family protein [Gammaproteobacteria bacterium]